MARPKIALVFDDSLDRPDGVQQQLWLMGRWLRENNWPAVYICSGTKATEIAGVAVKSLSAGRSIRANQNRLALPYPVSRRRIKALLRDEEIGIVHVMLPFSPWLGGRVVKAARAAGLPVIGTFHTYPANRWQRFGSRLYGKMFGRTLRQFDRLFSVSAATRDNVKQLFGVESEVMPNFIDTAAFSARDNSAKVKPAKELVFVGRLVRRKGPQHLLAALKWLKHTNRLSGIHLNISGDGPLRAELQAVVRSQGLTDAVTFTGFVDEKTKKQLLAQADLAVFPATGGEAFGIVLLEAMAAGALVLGGDNPGYRSVLGTVQLIDPAKPDVFGQRIYSLLTDNEERQRLLKSQQATINQYDVQAVMPRLAASYEEALALKAKLNHT